MTGVLIFERPSRSGGPPHRVRVDAKSLAPLACSCVAAQHDIVCWAVLEVSAEECWDAARQRLVSAVQASAPGDPARLAAHRGFAEAEARRQRARAVLAARDRRRAA